MKLREIAHSRTGDKGNISNISVIASLSLDTHGKSLSSLLMDMEI